MWSEQMDLVSARAAMGSARHSELRGFFAHVAQTPETHSVKGMYVGGIWDALAGHGVVTQRPRIHSFKDYPLREYMELLLDAAITLFPQHTPNDGLKCLGRLAIPTFATSIVGGVIMATVGRSWELALKCVSKGYEVSLKPGKATVAGARPGRAVLQLRDIWNFADSYQVGVVEGLIDWCHLRGQVTPQPLSAADCDLVIEWATADKRVPRARQHTSEASSSGP
jgi:uncharacterized protein (TIGR02265 family)